MHRWFRPKEDWILVLLGSLLLITAFRFFMGGMWPFAALTCMFFLPVAVIWYRQARARWCSGCQQPMQMERVVSGDDAYQHYRCHVCGMSRASGIRLEWPE